MNEQAFRLLSVRRLPARLKAEQVATLLNCHKNDVPVLVAAKKLKPLGNLPPNTVKLFAAAEVLEVAQDRTKLAKITETICEHWQQKNARKKGGKSAQKAKPEAEFPLELDSPKTGIRDQSGERTSPNAVTGGSA